MDDEFIRIKIFLIIGLCVGIPAVAWTLRLLFLHVQRGGRVSIFIIFLLFSDVLELFLIPSIVASDLTCAGAFFRRWYHPPSCEYHSVIMATFSGARLCGLCFHQLVALQSVWSLRHPCCSNCFSSPYCSILIGLTVWISTLIYFIHPILFVITAFILCAVAIIIAGFTCVLAIKASCSCANPGDTIFRNRGTRLRVLVVAMGTLWLLYAPFVVWFCVMLMGPVLITASMGVCLMSFRVAADPLLCVLVCREISHRDPSQTGIELNTVPTSD